MPWPPEREEREALEAEGGQGVHGAEEGGARERVLQRRQQGAHNPTLGDGAHNWPGKSNQTKPILIFSN